MLGFPLRLKRLLNALKESEDTTTALQRSLKKVFLIGSSTPPVLAEEFANTFSLNEFRSCYGMTEAGGLFTVPPSGEVSGTNQGFPFPGVKIKICGPDQVTYLELRDKLRHCVAWYRSQGVHKGNRVFVHVGNSIESFVAVCSVPMTGATFVSSECLSSEGEVVNKMKQAAITHVLTDDSYADMFARIMKYCDIKVCRMSA
ncbi:hypothetical protein MTO96_004385 [Rhipicephalus appendiculatus]